MLAGMIEPPAYLQVSPPAPPPPRAGRWRGAWAFLMSLVLPGLGHVYGRAWRPGVALLIVSQVATLGIHALSLAMAPGPGALLWFGAAGLAALAVTLFAAVDAARRVGGRMVRPAPPWFRSTWFIAVVVVGIGLGLDQVVPFGWRSFSIPSASMEPTLAVGDTLMADVRAPGALPARGDVVLFTVPGRDGAETVYVKRVVGLPGERVSLRGGVVAINGVPVGWRPDGTIEVDDVPNTTLARRVIETLPGGRTHAVAKLSSDGPMNDMPERLVPAGALFVMGDNRDNSADSRLAESPGQGFGYVPVGRVIGVAGTVYWARDWGRMLDEVR